MIKNRFSLLGLSLVALVAMAACGQSAEPPSYAFRDLGTLGGSNSAALGVNNRRQVVGWSTLSDDPDCLSSTGPRPCEYPVLWVEGKPTDLGHLSPGADFTHAAAINDAEVIVGTEIDHITADRYITKPFVYTEGGISGLPLLSQNPDHGGEAFDINLDGTVVGYSDDAEQAQVLATWSDGEVTGLGPSDGIYRRGLGINSQGWIAGLHYEPLSFRPHNGIFYRKERFSLLSDPRGVLSSGNAINDNGWIAGTLAERPHSPAKATIWMPIPMGGANSRVVGALDGHLSSEFLDMNSFGTAVGTSSDSDEILAILYHDGELYDLNDLVPVGNGILRSAEGINDNGDIVGWLEIDGNTRAFLLVPNG